MTKRRLTDQQRQRIQRRQSERREAPAMPQDGLPMQEGLVVGHFGRRIEVEPIPPDGTRIACHVRATVSDLVAGDRVVWIRLPGDEGVIEARHDRRSLLARPDARGVLKPVAANIDFITLVIAVEPALSTVLIDRYLVAAELQGINVRLLLNKTDLLTAEQLRSVESQLDVYRACGYTLLQCASKTGAGMADVDAMMAGNTSAFVGQSGVGKSSLVNRLLGDERAKVGELSLQSRLGRHTTTNAQLFHLARGGAIIDSPGIREFGLWHLSKTDVIRGFREFAPFLGGCRFSDCQHRHEPGCALRSAVQEGGIDERRLQSYFALIDGL